MSSINAKAGFDRLDSDQIEQGIRAGRRLQARAIGSALKALFSRRPERTDRDVGARMPDCAAPA